MYSTGGRFVCIEVPSFTTHMYETITININVYTHMPIFIQPSDIRQFPFVFVGNLITIHVLFQMQ